MGTDAFSARVTVLRSARTGLARTHRATRTPPRSTRAPRLRSTLPSGRGLGSPFSAFGFGLAFQAVPVSTQTIPLPSLGQPGPRRCDLDHAEQCMHEKGTTKRGRIFRLRAPAEMDRSNLGGKYICPHECLVEPSGACPQAAYFVGISLHFKRLPGKGEGSTGHS